MRRLIVAVAVVLAMGTWVRGQEPIRIHPVSSAPVYDMMPGHYPGVGQPLHPLNATGYSPYPPVRSTPKGDWARRCYTCCWSHHDNLDCGSLKADLKFIFGSCRTFYGERCLPPPLTVDHQGWWGAPAGTNSRLVPEVPRLLSSRGGFRKSAGPTHLPA